MSFRVTQSYNKGYRVVLNFETEIHQNSSFLYQIHSPKFDQIDAKSCLTKQSWQRRRIGATWPNAAPLPLPSLPPLHCRLQTPASSLSLGRVTMMMKMLMVRMRRRMRMRMTVMRLLRMVMMMMKTFPPFGRSAHCRVNAACFAASLQFK